ncbi:hypothetical protein [Lysobacter gummosus]|uniref:hypothetical protein n=1 Tax=Lysobacter gummosus TaxID=262324 RepID=UPI00362C90CF
MPVSRAGAAARPGLAIRRAPSTALSSSYSCLLPPFLSDRAREFIDRFLGLGPRHI